MIDIEKTIISQYSHSPRILSVIGAMNESIDPKHDIDAFYRDIWNIHTAKGWGLDVWGGIVGLSRSFLITFENQVIGFSDGFTPFNGGTWSSGADGNTGTFRLDDDAYRNIIMIKAAANINYPTAYHINGLLLNLFRKRGRAYYVKNGTMAARYVFEFTLNQIERSIIRDGDILPRPCGVLLDFHEPSPSDYLGFEESNLMPFNQGVFLF